MRRGRGVPAERIFILLGAMFRATRVILFQTSYIVVTLSEGSGTGILKNVWAATVINIGKSKSDRKPLD